MFVNRKDELRLLKELYDSRKKEVLILYGRRRAGKTELIKQFIKGNWTKSRFRCSNLRFEEAIYFLADKGGLENNSNRFYKTISKKYDLPSVELKDFRNAFEFLNIGIKGKRTVVIIDEFSYLLNDDNTPAVFQNIIDEILDDNVMLILCGSLMGAMENLLDYKNPLYGRRTAQLKLKPLEFFHVAEYFKDIDLETVVKIYGITGGIPMYFKLFSGKNFEDELLQNVFKKTSILYEEPEFILREELGDVHRYYFILEAIALGYNRISEISNFTGIRANDLPKYLKTLINLEFVEREIPITDSPKSKKGQYKIKDNFFRFWFNFVYPNKGEIEIETYTIDFLRFNQYLGHIFEDIAKEFLLNLSKKGELPFRFSKIGRWWHKGEEIDIVAMSKNNEKVLFAEVKWKKLTLREARGILKDLERKSQLVNLKSENYYFCLIAKSIDGKEELREENYLVYDLDDFRR
jgi:hypothetical protein